MSELQQSLALFALAYWMCVGVIGYVLVQWWRGR